MDLRIRLVDGAILALLSPESWLLAPELEKYLGCWKLEVPCA
jgi:hypothetical protein